MSTAVAPREETKADAKAQRISAERFAVRSETDKELSKLRLEVENFIGRNPHVLAGA